MGFGSDGRRDLFGWYHPPARPAHSCGVVICNPLGHEAVRAHRTIRHLAQRFAEAGFPTLRFDYHGTGDSAGADDDPARVASWTESIHAAADALRARSGTSAVGLVGIRMGATLAMLAAAEREYSQLVLWSPCVVGAGYVREMSIVAASLAQQRGQTAAHSAMGDALEAAGYHFSAETQRALDDVNLLERRPRGNPRFFVIGRKQGVEHQRLADTLRDEGFGVAFERLPGYAGMMAFPERTVIPDESLGAIVGWWSDRTDIPLLPDAGESDGDATLLVPAHEPLGAGIEIVQRPMEFGPDDRLFGLLTMPAAREATHDTAVICLTGGSVHRISANRMYVTLSRSLAGAGFPVLRMDFSGIGDSGHERGARENDLYPRSQREDVLAAMDRLRREHGLTRFVLLGLCSGAFGAFQTGLASEDVGGLVLINPIAFHWPEGAASPEDGSVIEARNRAHHRQAARGPRWRRVLAGRVSPRVVLRALRRRFTTRRTRPRHAGPDPAVEALRRDLKSLARRGTHITFLFSEGDPGHELVTLRANGTLESLAGRGQAAVKVFNGADHNFALHAIRSQLIDWCVTHCTTRWGRTA